MTRFFIWAAIAALGLIAAVTLISLLQHKVNAEQMWANLYVFTICLVAGALFTAVRKFEPNRLLAWCSCSLSSVQALRQLLDSWVCSFAPTGRGRRSFGSTGVFETPVL